MNKKIDLNNLDKSSWNSFTFEQIAKKISNTVQPTEAGVDVYVGLEHIDANDIHIRRRGAPSDVKGGKLRCSPGDVIFGKRRAYQRKAAIVDFEGICSAHAFVFHAIPKVIDPKLFPFFLHSDQFMHRMIDISVGGLSPTINWGDLRDQEFLLPPKAQQAEIAELLWSIDDVIQKNIDVVKQLSESKSAIQRTYFDRMGASFVTIDDCAQVYSGGTPSRKNAEFWGGEIPWAKTAEVNYKKIQATEEFITELGLNGSAAKLVPENSILLAMYGQGVTRGRVALTGIPLACNQACAIIEANADCQVEYIYSWLEYKYEDIRSLAHGANQQNLNLSMVKSFRIPEADLETQVTVVHKLQGVDSSLREARSNVEAASSLRSALINQVF